MLARYSREQMRSLWSPTAKFLGWLKVELAATQTRINRGEIKAQIPANLLNTVVINPEEIDRIERELTKHDVLAFLMHVSPQIPAELRPWLHHKLTSYDPQDTALSLTLGASIDILLVDVHAVMDVIRTLAFRYKNTPMIGRTHGVHAELITFGCKLAKWHNEMARHIQRLEQLKETVMVGKLSGAVGMYTLEPEIEEETCRTLGLQPVLATQIIPRDIIAEYTATLAVIAGSIANFCTTLRGLQRTEIREAMEYFDVNQRGSSAMPHKKNPITWESIVGICRDIGSRFMTAFQNQISWDERDLCNSAPERLFLPEVTIYLDYVLGRFGASLEKMIIFPERMKANLKLTRGLIFSQEVQALVAEKSGLPREEAYEIVRQVALRCWDSDFTLDFMGELSRTEKVMEHISLAELMSCFDLEKKLRFVDEIFQKAFGES